MKEETEKRVHHRRSIRLAGYDYASEGGYFITIVTHKRVRLFGEVVNGEVRLNEFGKIVYEEWFRTVRLRHNVELLEDEFVVMPNHIHGIIWINEDYQDGKGIVSVKDNLPVGAYSHTPLRSPSHTIGAIVRGYKGAVTTSINTIRNSKGIPVWQRNYYEHIISSENDYDNIVNYIYLNSFNWEEDAENTTLHYSDRRISLC
ncbi:MAG: transposase [Anaerolineaceae bacterium]